MIAVEYSSSTPRNVMTILCVMVLFGNLDNARMLALGHVPQAHIMPQLATIYHQCPDIDLLCANKHGWLGKCPRRLGLMKPSKD